MLAVGGGQEPCDVHVGHGCCCPGQVQVLPRAGLNLGETLHGGLCSPCEAAFHWTGMGGAVQTTLHSWNWVRVAWLRTEASNLQGQDLLPPEGLSVIIWRLCTLHEPFRSLLPAVGLWVGARL